MPYQVREPGGDEEYYRGTENISRAIVRDAPHTIKIIEINLGERQYPGLIIPEADNLIGVGAGIGGAAYRACNDRQSLRKWG